MRFLIALVAILGYANCAFYSPYAVGPTAGDIQAAIIDSNVAATDRARAIHEGRARAAEAIIQYNTEAVRRTAEANRNLNENIYWGNVAASQNLVAAAQSQAAAIDVANAAARGAAVHGAAVRVAPLTYGANYGLAGLPIAPLGLGYGIHGIRAW